MYSEQDLTNTKNQLKKIIILLVAMFVIFIVISVLIANSVNNKIGMAVMVLGVCLSIFLWCVYGAPIHSYYIYLKELIIGRSRNIKGVVKSISEHPIYKDNKLLYYEVTVEEDGITRVLLLDDQKEWPKINTNRLYDFQIHENFIRDIVNMI